MFVCDSADFAGIALTAADTSDTLGMSQPGRTPVAAYISGLIKVSMLMSATVVSLQQFSQETVGFAEQLQLNWFNTWLKPLPNMLI